MHVNKFNKIFKRNCDEFEFISGYSEYSSNVKATKIYNSKIYAKYYEAYFFSLFNRNKKDTSGHACNKDFEKCAYLDFGKNTFWVKRSEFYILVLILHLIFMMEKFIK
jgi:hypothetical protein